MADAMYFDKEVASAVDSSHNNFVSYDTWGNEGRTKIFKALKSWIVDHYNNGFKYNNTTYIVLFTEGNRDGSYPDSISVRQLITIN